MILAIDIGGTFIKFGLVDDDFRISSQSKESTPTTIDDFWRILESIVSSFKNDISANASTNNNSIQLEETLQIKNQNSNFMTIVLK